MMLTIVIPTLNRLECLGNTLRDIERQDFTDYEILVVDQSDGPTHEKIKQLFSSEKVCVIHSEIRSASLARNLGIRHAKGEVVLFLDDDIVIKYDGFLGAHMKHYSDPSCPGVSGAILDHSGVRRSHRHKLSENLKYGWLFFPINYDKQVKIFNGWAGNLSVRTNWARNIGGMDQRFEKGAFREESDFCYRLCSQYGPLTFDPLAALIHIGAPTGGLRDFAEKQPIKAQHHFNGMFYFLFKNIPLKHFPIHLLAFLKIFFRKEVVKRPGLLLELIKRTCIGIKNGISMNRKGPVYLS